MKFQRNCILVLVITLCLLKWMAVSGLAAEDSTSGTTAGPSTGNPQETSGKIELISAEELKKLIDERADILVVDTQDQQIYPINHIKGAINFPWAEVIAEPIDLPRSKLLILYCGCEGETASKDVARQLMSQWGFKQVKVLDGGFNRWLKLGYPTEP